IPAAEYFAFSERCTTWNKVAPPPCVTYPCVVRLSVSALLVHMNRWIARVLLLLLLMGTFGPVALAISASAPHACCMRKPMRRSGHENAFQSVSHHDHRCCTPLASTHWAQAETVRRVHVTPPATAAIFGSVSGLIRDPQHRPVQGAQVTLRSTTSDWNKSAASDDSGEFHFDSVPLGDYRITVELAGFATQAQDLALIPGRDARLHFS